MNDSQKTEERVENDWLAAAGEMLHCLSIRQPWAWLILHGGKDIENRNWSTKVRGRVLVHAAKGMTQAEWRDAVQFAHWGDPRVPQSTLQGCECDELERGGIVGTVEIVDCVASSVSPWFVGRYGFVLRDPRPLPFVPWKGALGFFGVPRSALAAGESAPRFHTTPLPSHDFVSTR